MDMVERVARAICYANVVQANEIRKAAGQGHKALIKTDEELRSSVDNIWMTCAASARAAIEAMREPTVDMVAAFWRQKNCGTQEVGETGEDRSDYAAWRSAISAALNEPVESR